MPEYNFHYSHLLPERPGVCLDRGARQKACIVCGAAFTCLSPTKVRCDTCQAARKERQRKAAAARQAAKRKAAKDNHEPGRRFGSRSAKFR